MSRYVPDVLRREVAQRAGSRCEYCLMPLHCSLFPFQVDHVVSIKHGGETISENLAYAFGHCNINKGSDLGTFLGDANRLIRFFNPRTDRWSDHFEFVEGAIYAKTIIGEATVKIFLFNLAERVIERRALIESNLYF